MSIYTIGYFLELALLSYFMYWLVSTNSWTPGKKVVTIVVGMLWWNYFWACLNISLLDQVSLDSVKGWGYQIPNLFLSVWALKILRGGKSGSNS